MKNKWIRMLLIAVLVVFAVSQASADTFNYIRYISTGKGVAGSGTHQTNTRAYVTQTSNVNTVTSSTGPKIHYGVRKTDTTSGPSICGAMSISGYSGSTSALYNTTVSNNSTVYLVVQPATTATTGQWEIAGTWNP